MCPKSKHLKRFTGNLSLEDWFVLFTYLVFTELKCVLSIAHKFFLSLRQKIFSVLFFSVVRLKFCQIFLNFSPNCFIFQINFFTKEQKHSTPSEGF